MPPTWWHIMSDVTAPREHKHLEQFAQCASQRDTALSASFESKTAGIILAVSHLTEKVNALRQSLAFFVLSL